MNDKYLKAIARELRLIRIELQKLNQPPSFSDGGDFEKGHAHVIKAGERVTIK